MKIAPRLKSGQCREGFGSRLPPEVKAGFKAIARREGRSMSWVMEEVLIDYFDLPRPVYIELKKGLDKPRNRR